MKQMETIPLNETCYVTCWMTPDKYWNNQLSNPHFQEDRCSRLMYLNKNACSWTGLHLMWIPDLNSWISLALSKDLSTRTWSLMTIPSPKLLPVRSGADAVRIIAAQLADQRSAQLDSTGSLSHKSRAVPQWAVNERRRWRSQLTKSGFQWKHSTDVSGADLTRRPRRSQRVVRPQEFWERIQGFGERQNINGLFQKLYYFARLHREEHVIAKLNFVRMLSVLEGGGRRLFRRMRIHPNSNSFVAEQFDVVYIRRPLHFYFGNLLFWKIETQRTSRPTLYRMGAEALPTVQWDLHGETIAFVERQKQFYLIWRILTILFVGENVTLWFAERGRQNLNTNWLPDQLIKKKVCYFHMTWIVATAKKRPKYPRLTRLKRSYIGYIHVNHY